MDVAILAVLLAGQPVPLAPRTEPSPPQDVEPTDAAPAPEAEASDVVVPAAPKTGSATEVEPEAAAQAGAAAEVSAEPEAASEATPATVADDPEPLSEPVANVTEDERPPLDSRPGYAEEELQPTSVQNPNREGGFISVSVGAGHCGTWCSHMAALGSGRFEAGYRWGTVAVGASASLAGGTYDTPASENSDIYFTVEASGSTRFFHVGPVLQFFPIAAGRFDPYASVGIGFRRAVDVADVDGISGEVKYWESGAGATLGAGIPVYVTDRVALGLRYDKSFAIAGKVCATIDGQAPDGVEECEDWSDQTEDLNTVDSRFVRLARPRPWTVAFELRVVF